MRLSLFGWVFLAFITAFLPWVAMRSTFRVRRSGVAPTRARHLGSVAFTQGGMLVLALTAARSDFVWLFPRRALGAVDVAIVVAFLAVALGSLPARWRWKPLDERWRILWMYPQCAGDFWWWALVSLTAGIVEEIVYRGVLFTLWQRVLGNWWAATTICVVAFALAHFVQGWRAMIVIVLFTVVFHGIVGYTGDLYTVMAAHVLYDLLAGFMIFRLSRQDPAPGLQGAG